MNDLLDFEALKITIASPEQIRGWSFGEVTKPETINYRTLKAEKDGLFSENIFGPTKDYECYCGKYKRIRYRGVICDKCGVEVTQSRVRRERMGHITLAAPVAHNWFVKGAPSKLSLILDISPKNLEAVVYFASYIVTSVDPDKKTIALERLTKDLQAKIEASKSAVDAQIKELEEANAEEIKKIKKSQAGEKGELLSEETQLKVRHEIQKLRDNNVVEQGQLENIYKVVTDLVKSIVPQKLLSEDEFYKLDEYGVADFAEVGMGADALLQILKTLDLDKMAATLRDEVRKSTGQKHIKATKRLRIIEGMRGASIQAEWMVLRILPVLPPDLRPMVQLPGGRFATSDLNDLYRRVINRNNRLNRLINLGAPEIILRNEKRMLQEAVDALIDSSQRSARRTAPGHILRSLSDMLRGKQGRFRQNLLGKRVDYSGRSVIVVGPTLKLNQVGLPREMALEMFKPFVLREMISRGIASNVKGAKNVLETRPPEVWDILEEVIEGHPILINRAPTLHRLGIQAFFPILVDGNAIAIHPCICAGFNADFDGDQMAVHVPLSTKAQEEAKNLMMAKENIFGPANGQPLTIPNREMALGCYFTTLIPDDPTKNEQNMMIFSSEAEAIMAYQTKNVGLRDKIKLPVGEELIETSVGRIIFNQVLPVQMRFLNIPVRGVTIREIILKAMETLNKDEVADLIDRIKAIGFWGATIAGVSIGIFDAKILPEKKEFLARAEVEIKKIEGNFAKGLITREEKSQLSQGVWIKTTEELANATWDFLGTFNPIRMLVEAGARGSRDQAKQLSAMRGLSTDPTGKIVDLPTKANYREGLSVFEYFTSCRGARKGVADKALKTADAGYLTRRLVDVAHDVIVRMEDCGTKEGMDLALPADNLASAISIFLGRCTHEKIADPKTKKQIVAAGTFLTEREIQELMKAGIKSILVRSALTCESRIGLCSACYGLDLTTRKPVQMGVPVGVMAAQSIGEPGTQLTMRTFHTGGIVSVDITSGLPRVEELYEARVPKVVAPVSEIAGKVTISETETGVIVRVRTTSKPHEEREYLIPAQSALLVEDGQLISAGTALSTGHLDIKEILRIQGLRAAQRYIIDEVRKVYETQGVQINERHFEVIVRKMSDKVRIETQGNTNLLPGEVIDKIRFEEENERVLAGGGDPATAEVIILGITRASLQTESFLSAASFQETTTVLSEAAAQGKVDRLIGLKENVIIGRLIPTNPDRAKLEA